MKCLLGLLWKRANVFVKIFTPPRHGRLRGFFVTIARDFQNILKLEVDFIWVDFYIEIC